MPCHYSKGGEVLHIECPSCGHQFPHEPMEAPEEQGDEAVEHAEKSESPEQESRPSFIAALRRRRVQS